MKKLLLPIGILVALIILYLLAEGEKQVAVFGAIGFCLAWSLVTGVEKRLWGKPYLDQHGEARFDTRNKE
jgi:positive regulator of sigma E activity